MSNNTTSSIITIGRKYGSAGRQIGQEVAKYFGIKCYDKELLEHAANDSGICKELFEHHDEKPTNSFLYSLVMDTYSFVSPQQKTGHSLLFRQIYCNYLDLENFK